MTRVLALACYIGPGRSSSQQSQACLSPGQTEANFWAGFWPKVYKCHNMCGAPKNLNLISNWAGHRQKLSRSEPKTLPCQNLTPLKDFKFQVSEDHNGTSGSFPIWEGFVECSMTIQVYNMCTLKHISIVQVLHKKCLCLLVLFFSWFHFRF